MLCDIEKTVTRDGMYINDRQELETEKGNQMPLRPNNEPTKRREKLCLFHDRCPTHVSYIMPAGGQEKGKDNKRD